MKAVMSTVKMIPGGKALIESEQKKILSAIEGHVKGIPDDDKHTNLPLEVRYCFSIPRVVPSDRFSLFRAFLQTKYEPNWRSGARRRRTTGWNCCASHCLIECSHHVHDSRVEKHLEASTMMILNTKRYILAQHWRNLLPNIRRSY